jgi:outer membrane protein assembly factor BamB
MKSFALAIPLILFVAAARGSDDWPQLQGDALRSGNAAGAVVKTPLGLVGAVPLTDGIYAAPAVADGKVFVQDGSGVVSAIDARTLEVLWRFATHGGPGNCNNVAAPAVIGK